MFCRRFAEALALTFLLALGAACAGSRTEILLVVSSDLEVPDQIDRLQVRAYGVDFNRRFEQTYDLSKTPGELSWSLGLLPPSEGGNRLYVELVAFKGDEPVVSRSANTRFVDGQIRVLHLDLQASCEGRRITCPIAGSTCVAGTCLSDFIDPATLPPFTGKDAAASDLRRPALDSTRGFTREASSGGTADANTERAEDIPGHPDAEAGPADTSAAPDARSPNGATCTSAAACASGQCVDGICCESACVGGCMTCSEPSSPGRCVAVPLNTVCAPPRCQNDQFVPAATCNAGACTTPPLSECGPSACTVGGCKQATLVTIDNPEASTMFGDFGPATSVFQDTCPDGSAVIGFDTATKGAVVGQLRTLCGVARVSTDGISLALSPGAQLVLRGTAEGPIVTSMCPPNQFVVGLDGRNDVLIDQISLRCAPVRVAGISTSRGTPTNLEPIGGPGGRPAPRQECPTGTVAIGTNLAVRDWIAGVGLNCARIGVR